MAAGALAMRINKADNVQGMVQVCGNWPRLKHNQKGCREGWVGD